MLLLHYLIKTLILIFVMYLEAKETARLYKLLSDKLGSDTTEAMFKYIIIKQNAQWKQPLKHWRPKMISSSSKMKSAMCVRRLETTKQIPLNGCLFFGLGRL